MSKADVIMEIPSIKVQKSGLTYQSKKAQKGLKQISILFIATGIFAAVGALYRWGEGPLFNAPAGTDVSLLYADLFLTAPLSIITGKAYKNLKPWAPLIGMLTAGIYLFGSFLVYASLIQNGAPYPLKLIIPPIFGI